jgi:hypothetical protein
MATGNGKGSWLPELLAEMQALRSDMHAHVESTTTAIAEMAARFDAYARDTRERFAGMDQNLVRMARILTAVGERIEDHEARLSRLEGR